MRNSFTRTVQIIGIPYLMPCIINGSWYAERPTASIERRRTSGAWCRRVTTMANVHGAGIAGDTPRTSRRHHRAGTSTTTIAIEPDDGDERFGLRVVATPGHTPGHISLLDPELDTLLTGDALFHQNDRLIGSPERFNADTAQANQSVRRLGTLAFERALFGHGEPLDRGAAAAVRQLGATLP